MGRLALAAVVVCAIAAGCGGSDPHLARADVAPLIALSTRIATEQPCAQKRDLADVRRRAIALVNAKAVPPALQEPFLAGVNDLASRTPVCTPPAPAAKPQPEPPEDKRPHDRAKGHEKKHGGDG